MSIQGIEILQLFTSIVSLSQEYTRRDWECKNIVMRKNVHAALLRTSFCFDEWDCCEFDREGWKRKGFYLVSTSEIVQRQCLRIGYWIRKVSHQTEFSSLNIDTPPSRTCTPPPPYTYTHAPPPTLATNNIDKVQALASPIIDDISKTRSSFLPHSISRSWILVFFFRRRQKNWRSPTTDWERERGERKIVTAEKGRKGWRKQMVIVSRLSHF